MGEALFREPPLLSPLRYLSSGCGKLGVVSVAGFFIILAIAILFRFAGNRLIPVAMPTGVLRTVALGWAGGFLGSLVDSIFWQFGPEVAEINLVAAAIGCALFILILGVVPFVKILLGRV